MNTGEKLFQIVLPAIVAFGLSATVALAQGTPGGNIGPGPAGSNAQPGGQVSSGTPGTTTTPPGFSNYSTSNVTTADPFGDINTANAGTTSTSVGTWARGLNERQRAEMTGRCNIVTGAGNETRYRTDDIQLCRNYSTAMGSSAPSPTQTR